jgi:bacterioferritin (cytochrome b1)
MGEQTDAAALSGDLAKLLPLLARDATAAAVVAGTLPGAEGIALSGFLRDVAADELRDLERIAARIASLGGSPNLTGKRLVPPMKFGPAVKGLVAMQRETLDAVVDAIPADADDAEGEASEHLLEHMVSRKRDVIEVLERALRT